MLAGIGVYSYTVQSLEIDVNTLQHVTAPPDNQKNFLVVDSKTDNATIEEAFNKFTTERKDIGILLINQHVSLALYTSNEHSFAYNK